MSDDTTPEDLQKFDQSTSLVADVFPPFWKRMFDNLVREKFTEDQAMEILIAWIQKPND
jgi:hypothetical protein